MTRIHIACSARNAERWLDAFIEGLQAQTHQDWELWLRDDGSTDGTWGTIESWAAREPRVAQTFRGEESLGVAHGFGYVIARLPPDAAVVATGDADDVWLPGRLEVTLRALRDAEAREPGIPILVHTDLRVVDESLRERAPSLWREAGMHPHAATLPGIAIENIAVAPTLLFNGALLSLVRDFPPEALFQDWWLTLVAAATGRVVTVDEATVLYRQHGGNSVGVRPTGFRLLGRALTAWGRRGQLHRHLKAGGNQAAALLARFGDRISPSDAEALRGLATIATRRGWARKVAIARYRWHPRHGTIRNIGVLLRG